MDPQSFLQTSIARRYEILAVAGKGGMGTVFKARQAELDRFVALKVLDPGFVRDDDAFKRFEREARSLSLLSHVHIAGFYSYGVLDDSTPYIVMEFVEGKNLSQEMEQRLSIERVLQISLQVAAAMGYAHEQGIIHRDLKPANILLQAIPGTDHVKVLDFGLSFLGLPSPDSTGQKLTSTGCVLGTPQYLSPEQCQGQKADARSDIYALGCIMYEMICACPPFEAENPLALIHMHVSEAPRSLAKRCRHKLPAGLELIVLKCLEKDPFRRYQTMQEVFAELTRVLQGVLPEVQMHAQEKRSRIKLPTSRKFWISAASIMGLALLGYAVWFYSDAGLNNRCRTAMLNYNNTNQLMYWLSEARRLRQKGDFAGAEELSKTIEHGMHLDSMMPLEASQLRLKLAERLYKMNDIYAATRFAMYSLGDLRASRKVGRVTGFAGDVIDSTSGDFRKLSFKQVERKAGFANSNDVTPEAQAFCESLLALNWIYLNKLDRAKPYAVEAVKTMKELKARGKLDEDTRSAAQILLDAYNTEWDKRIPFVTRAFGSHECELEAIMIGDALFPGTVEFHSRFVFARSFISVNDPAGAVPVLEELRDKSAKDSDAYVKCSFDLAGVRERLGDLHTKSEIVAEYSDHFDPVQLLISIAKGQIWAANYKEAEATLKQAEKKADKNFLPGSDLIEVYYTYALCFGDAGDYPNEEHYLKLCLSLFPAQGRKADGRLYRVSKDLDDCLRHQHREAEGDEIRKRYDIPSSRGDWFLSNRRAKR